MSSYVIPASPVVGLPIAGSDDLFPVRRVYCVGRNYAEHAKEMGFTGRGEGIAVQAIITITIH